MTTRINSGVAASPLDPIDPIRVGEWITPPNADLARRWGVPWHVMLDAHQPPPRPADRVISTTPLPIFCRCESPTTEIRGTGPVACTSCGRRVPCP